MTGDPDSAALEHVARAISDGDPLPSWVDTAAEPLRSRLLAIAEIGRYHREALKATDTSATIGAPPPTSKGTVTSTWTHFHLFERIGHGTSGEVYRAWDNHMARDVALKLRVTAADDPAPMVVEARRLARVRHPHFVTVHGIARADGYVGTWMELLKGRTLFELVRDHGPLNANEAALIGADVCSALAAVHRAGLLHRDVKAQNVIREHAGRIVLLDLSASRDVDEETADLAGTPAYLAPELFAGSPASVASDIYATAALLFFLTTGSAPIEAASIAELRRAHERGNARTLRDVRPDLPRPFVELVDRGLASRPEDRFATAGEFEAALTAFLTKRNPGGTAVEIRPLRRVPIWMTALLVAIAAVVASLLTNRFGRPDSGSVDRVPPNPARVIAPEQLKVARAIEELGASFAEQGNWQAAREQFVEAEKVFRIHTGPDTPLVARALMQHGWAAHQLGHLEDATRAYDLATAKFATSDLRPMMSAVQMALADVHQRAGRPDAAAQAVNEALEHRARSLGLEPRSGPPGLARLGLSPGEFQRAFPRWSLARDQDADGLPDALEFAVGLNPLARDSDEDGTADGLEDQDSDGLSNELEFGLPLNPTRVIAHYGAVDPELAGFQQRESRRQKGSPSPDGGEAAWRVHTREQFHYSWPLSRTQRKAALSRGWRLSSRGSALAGRAFSSLDLGPESFRFDLEFETGEGGWFVHRNTNAVPRKGITDRVSSTPDWGLVELEYSSSSRSALLFLNGRLSGSAPSTGHNQFLEDSGLFFGAALMASGGGPAQAEFRLVMLVIR